MTDRVWEPSASTRAAGERARVRYLAARATEPGEQRAPSAALRVLRDTIVHVWSGVRSGGMERESSRRGEASTDPHRDGIAIDFMLVAGARRVAVGDALASWFVEHAEELGVQYVLHRRYEWSASTHGPRWESYTYGDPHEDHVHVELGVDARGWPASVMRARVEGALRGADRSWLLPGVLTVLLALGAWLCSSGGDVA